MGYALAFIAGLVVGMIALGAILAISSKRGDH